jgi:hypothetical protein
MLGYIFFVITLLFYSGLALFTLFESPSPGGDRAMAYGLGMIFLNLGFAVSSLALTITLLAKGNFHWITTDASTRNTIVLMAWLCLVVTTFFCTLFKEEWHSDDNTYPQFLHVLALWNGQIWIPLLWLTACFLSLNTNWQASFSPILIKGSFFTGLFISVIYAGGLMLGYVRDSARQAAVKAAAEKQRDDQWHQQTLDFIASQKPEDPIINLLVHSNQVQEADVRQAALAKIQAHADAEAEILALLNAPNPYAQREVYYFLDGNKVIRSHEFAESLNKSISVMAASIRTDIKDSNNLQSWSFDSYGISQLLRAIDEQFQGQGIDFRPNIHKLSQALRTTPPDRFKDVRFSITYAVDAWLSQHK